MFNHLNSYLKAHAAGLGAALTLLIADLNTGAHVSSAQWLAIAGAYLGVAAAVATVPNTKAPDAEYPVPAAADGAQDDLKDAA